MKKSIFTSTIFFLTIFFALNACAKSFSAKKQEQPACPPELKTLMNCYPDVKYEAEYVPELDDWKIELSAVLFYERTKHAPGNKTATLYWANGRMLPLEELSHKDEFWPLQYKYNNKVRDPKTYSQEEIEQIDEMTSRRNRRSQAGTPMFFFDFLYSASSQIIMEDHIIRTTFLGKPTKIHERIYDKLKKTEKEILEQAKTDSEVKTIVEGLKSCDAYHWREIDGTNRKSFHSYGIALDMLPRRLYGKAIYWSWEKDKQGSRWMLTPLEKRWTPGQKIIDIFEQNGFIWGGNWVIFDNMHFEYHPELVNKTAYTDVSN